MNTHRERAHRSVGLPGGDAAACEDLPELPELGRGWKHDGSCRQDGRTKEEVRVCSFLRVSKRCVYNLSEFVV